MAAATNPLLQLIEHGQSYWLDNLSRQKIESGELRRRVAEEGLRGITSNPEIFHRAITQGADYDAPIAAAAAAGQTAAQIYESLAVEDIRNACDILRPVYDSADGADGFISLEVSPHLARDTAGSIAEARRLNAAVGRPNLLIKIPGTREGLPAIETLLADGINVNITLLFSVARYEAVAEAYLKALEKRVEAGAPVNRIASVASFFLSRIDVMVDELLDKQGSEAAKGLRGKIAVANAKLAYQSFGRLFAGERWQALARAGARPQRLLWASTSTKNPSYSDVLYVEPLIGRHTVNTMPDQTVAAFADHGTVADTVEQGAEEARQAIAALAGLGIDLGAVTDRLEEEGIDKFIKPFDALMQGLEEKRAGAVRQRVAAG